MSDTKLPNVPSETAPAEPPEPDESFEQLLSQHERSRSRQPGDREKGLQGTVIAVKGDAILLDIGFKTEGILPLSALGGQSVEPGEVLPVSVQGRDEDGYYQLARGKGVRPKDWSALERAYAEKEIIVATVTEVIRGGLSVDAGVRAFLPASRSGARDAAELEQLVGQPIRCRITKLDVRDEDVVVDRRAVLEEEEQAAKQRRYGELREGEIVRGEVRSLMDYGAFVDLGGIDGLLHVSDIAWSRVNKPSDVLSVGQQIEAQVLKLDPERGRISLGLKQLQPHPWDAAAEKYKVGERVRGSVSRLAPFGAFVELEPGIEGLIHISEMSWSKKVRTPGDLLKEGEAVEAVILGVNPRERRISLGLKQALGDPWAEAAQKFPVGSAVEGKVTSITKFGAFVQLTEGVEGMIHVGEISAEKRIQHPQDVLKVGQTVKAQVLEVNTEKRRISLSMKQLVPTSLDEYIAEHKEGDVVSGRMGKVRGDSATVELGEGVQGICRMKEEEEDTAATAPAAPVEPAKADLSSLTSMLNARWKGGAASAGPSETARVGQVRTFRITKLDPTSKKIELELQSEAQA